MFPVIPSGIPSLVQSDGNVKHDPMRTLRLHTTAESAFSMMGMVCVIDDVSENG